MSDTEKQAEQQGQDQQDKVPVLGDGVGLDYGNVAALLSNKCKVVVDLDDPILMMVPLCNAFLEEERKLMEQHKKVLAAVLSEKTGGFVASVQRTADELGKTLASSTVKSLEDAMQQHQANIRWWGLVATVSALLNIAFVAFFIWGASHGR